MLGVINEISKGVRIHKRFGVNTLNELKGIVSDREFAVMVHEEREMLKDL
jgi:hypothetical protein